MSRLKPCPFCGDEVEIIATGLYHWKYAIRHKSKAECVLDADAFVLPYEKEEAVRMWNIRADRKTEPTISKMEQVEDEPQTEPLHTCSVNGRPYSECSSCEHFKCTADELQTEEIYPLVVIEDRYTGIYSCGKYTAWNMFCDEIPQAIDSDDVLCRDFWHSYEGVVGLGATPNEAIEDLRQKLLVFANTPKDEPQTDFWHSATKDDWLKAHGIENE